MFGEIINVYGQFIYANFKYAGITFILYCFNLYQFIHNICNKLFQNITNPEKNISIKYYNENYENTKIYCMKLYDPKQEHIRIFRSFEKNFPTSVEQQKLELMSNFLSNILSVIVSFTTLNNNNEEVEHSVEILEFLDTFLYPHKQIFLDKSFLTMYIQLTSEEDISNLNTIDNLNILLVHKDMDIMSSKILIDVDHQKNVTIKKLTE